MYENAREPAVCVDLSALVVPRSHALTQLLETVGCYYLE